jgi:hypothetical protein
VTPLKVVKHRFSITALAAITAFCCLGAATDANGQNAPRARSADNVLQHDVNAVVGGSIAITGAVAAVAIVFAVNHDHHTLKGCVSSGPNGPELQTSDSKTYSLEGDSSAIKVGDMVKFHGSKVKKVKDSSANQVFIVEEMKKNYGPCHVTAVPAAGATR